MRLHASSHAYGLWTSRTKSTIGPEHPTTPRRKHEKTQDSKCWLTKIWRHLGDWCPCFSDCQRWLKGNYLSKPGSPWISWLNQWTPLKIEKMNYLCKLNMLHGNQTWAETCPHWISGIFNKRLKPAFMGDLPAMLVTRKVPWNPLKITIFVLVKTVNPWRIVILCLSSHYFFSRNHQKPPCPMGFSKKTAGFLRLQSWSWTLASSLRCGTYGFNATYEYTITVKLYDI